MFVRKPIDIWIEENKEYLRYDYPLNEESIVLDLGVYNGEFSKKIIDKYNCRVYGFEPVGDFFCRALKNLGHYSNFKLFNYGIGGSNRIENICLNGDSTSIYDPLNHITFQEEIEIRSIKDVMEELSFVSIDLIKINVEGMEYEILECLLECEYIRLFKAIQVQFHECVPNCYDRRSKIVERILETHEITYAFPFCWESFHKVK